MKTYPIYERLLDRLHEMAREAFGPNISISVDGLEHGRGGFIARVWNARGFLAYSDETPRPSKVLACRALRKGIESMSRLKQAGEK